MKIVFSHNDSFSKFSGLRLTMSKYEIAGIDILKNVNVALCGMKNVELTKETIKIFGLHISFNKKLQDDSNFRDSIKNIVNLIRLWRMRKLKIILKSVAISKIVWFSNSVNPENLFIGKQKTQNQT